MFSYVMLSAAIVRSLKQCTLIGRFDFHRDLHTYIY